jgi:hypothetical protein
MKSAKVPARAEERNAQKIAANTKHVGATQVASRRRKLLTGVRPIELSALTAASWALSPD